MKKEKKQKYLVYWWFISIDTVEYKIRKWNLLTKIFIAPLLWLICDYAEVTDNLALIKEITGRDLRKEKI